MPMPKQARDYRYQENYGYRSDYGYQRPYPQSYQNVYPQRQPSRPHPSTTTATPYLRPVRPKRVARRKKVNPLAQLISWSLIGLIGFFVIPFGYDRISKPLIFGSPYKEVQVDYSELLNPTSDYLSNTLFLNSRLLNGAKVKKPEMTTLYTTDNMPVLQAKLQRLMFQYKTIDPSIFVWDYDSGKYVDIKATKEYSAASIIKIPVLIQLFKSIEANQLTIYDEMAMTPYFRSEGSGNLQGLPDGTNFTIDQLARVMITKSDNSATNMLMTAIGSMEDVNAGIRSWGLKHTHVNNWLPDIAGTNYTTAKDLATMLYNLDNPGFLSINSREYMIDYMSHVENNRLIAAGLDKKALFVHKTGDIGKMLGDAGIVYTPSGKKYICVILANRPYNSPLGKDFIQKASALIYQTMTTKGGY